MDVTISIIGLVETRFFFIKIRFYFGFQIIIIIINNYY